MPRSNWFQGATTKEIEQVDALLENGRRFLEALQVTVTRVQHSLRETNRFRESVKRGDTVLDWTEALMQMEGYNEFAKLAAEGATLKRFDLGKITLAATSGENHTALIMSAGLIKEFLSERYGVSFKVRIEPPKEPEPY